MLLSELIGIMGARAGCQLAKAEHFQFPAHRCHADGDTKLLTDPGLKVDQPPANNPVYGRIGTTLDDIGQSCALAIVKLRRFTCALPSITPYGPSSLNHKTQSRKVWRSTPPPAAASLREAPSQTAASARRRRTWCASRDLFAAFRRSASV